MTYQNDITKTAEIKENYMPNDTKELDPIWDNWTKMMTHIFEHPKVNEAGKRFTRGVAQHLESFGYLSEKQKAVVKQIYDNSFN